MFPLVLPRPLSKKWGAKLAWAKKNIEQIDTHTFRGTTSHQHGPESSPSPGQAGTPSPTPAHPWTRLGSSKEGPFTNSTHETQTIWGA